MCGCQQHSDRKAPCSCSCPEHVADHDWTIWALLDTGEREATCSCGWKSRRCRSLDEAEVEVEVHIGEPIDYKPVKGGPCLAG